jgi:hypothetical protein
VQVFGFDLHPAFDGLDRSSEFTSQPGTQLGFATFPTRSVETEQ